MKIIKIKACENCPFIKHIEIYDYDPDITCTHIETDGCTIENEREIPEWCPLSETQDDKENSDSDVSKSITVKGRNFLDACKDVFENNVIYRRENSDMYIKKSVDWIVFYMNHQKTKSSSLNRTDITSLWYEVRLTRKQVREW